jgi:hypothetical protein
MRRRMLASVLVFSVAVFLLPVSGGAFDGTPGEGDLKRVRKKVESLRAWRITEELDLDEETSARLFPVMREADEEGWRIEARNRSLIRDMALQLKSTKPDPGVIKGILDGLQANRMEKARSENRHLKRVREILSPEDTARYLLFQLSFQRELKEKAARAFREGRKGMGPGVLRNDSKDGAADGGGGKR